MQHKESHMRQFRSTTTAIRERVKNMRQSLWMVGLGALVMACNVQPELTSSQDGLTGADGNVYVNLHRNRLLDSYAAYKGLGSRVNAWNTFNQKQRDLFLIQTDLLGNRSFMGNVAPIVINTNPCPGEGESCDSGCDVQQPGAAGLCVHMDANGCVQNGYCFATPGVRTDFAMALEHVTQLYELLAPNSNCGGDDNNRIFWSADAQLIGYFRNYAFGLPMWDTNGDLGGPHSPFNNASSTLNGRPFSCDGPDGQAQFFSFDWQAVGFQRGAAFLPADGHMFELDDDYDTVHNSSPECFYCGGQFARSMYESHWCSRQGNGAPCDWGYAP
jgi:hypothetical protein